MKTFYVQTYTSKGYTEWLKVLENNLTEYCQDVPHLSTMNALIPQDSVPLFYLSIGKGFSVLFLSGLLSHLKYPHRAYHKILVHFENDSSLELQIASAHAYLSLSPFDLYNAKTHNPVFSNEISKCFELVNVEENEEIKFDRKRFTKILSNYFTKIEKNENLALRLHHEIVKDTEDNRMLLLSHLLANQLNTEVYGNYVLSHSATIESLQNHNIDWGISNHESLKQGRFHTKDVIVKDEITSIRKEKEEIDEDYHTVENVRNNNKNRNTKYYWVAAILTLLGIVYKALKCK